MKFSLDLPLFFLFSLFVSPHLCTEKNGVLFKKQCSTVAKWTIDNINTFKLSNTQFDEFSSKKEGKTCKGLRWVNVTSDNWSTGHPDAIRLDPDCSSLVCRCLDCGNRGLKNQAFCGYVDPYTGICHVPWDVDMSIKQYQILTNPCGLQTAWVKAGKGAKWPTVPPCAVVGGFEATASTYVWNATNLNPAYVKKPATLSYVGRATAPNGGLYVGKVNVVDRMLWYPIEGKQLASVEYEVLAIKY